MPTLGQEIATARKKAGWSQKDLAERTLREDGQPISAQYLNDIERDRRSPAGFILNALAEQLKLDSDYLHFMAGQVPPDLAGGSVDDARLNRAIAAFRRTYKSK
jgi:transcriptional regulator with XRE-family HTH domain